MEKIHIVKHSKEPSLLQIKRMSFNLRNKFKKAAVVQVQCMSYSKSDPEFTYYLWIDNHTSTTNNSWKECQDAYFSLMEEKVDE